jgi:hypothetical protein
MHVETDDILDFLSEGGIVGFFEGPDAVGLEAAGIPDPLYSAQTDADCLGDGESWPGKFGQDDKWIFCLRAA